MRYFLISLFLVLSGCSLKTTEDLIAIPISEKSINNTYFSDANQDYIYKAKIDVYGHNFGGILILKKISNESHRLVFTTEFGNTLFDFTIGEDSFNVNYILPEMDKKIFLKTLENDFRLLISEEAIVLNQYSAEDFMVFKTQRKKKFNFYFFENSTLKKIVNTSKTKEKLIISFSEIDSHIAEKINLEHQNIKLSIQLNFLKQDKNAD